MRSTLRSFAFGLAGLLATGAMAQQPYTIIIQGAITNCYPGQTVNVQTAPGVQPSYNFDVTADPNSCTWSATMAVASNPAAFQVTTLCGGMVVTVADSVGFSFFVDTAFVQITLNCGGGQIYDCNGVQNGPDMPGTACDDGDPATMNDTWNSACVCTGADSSGTYDCLGILNGSALPGTYCVWNNQQGSWSTDCVCTPDSGGFYDCLWVMNGQNMPGTYCIDFFGDTGVWSTTCVCEVNSGAYDCLGQLNGPNMPGTPCTYTPDNGNTWISSIWTADCVCGPDSTFQQYDCLGMLNGPNMPGTACNDGDPATLNDTWNSACVCTGNTPNPCNADFWVLQAFGSDSLPIPYELWVWNLSGGGNGNFTYLWSFGDGTSSTEAYPSHTYSGSGPYVLCLTIADNNSCTDQHCDSISIDGNGIYSGMVGGGTDRQDGFTINVQNPQANAVDEHMVVNDIVAWPNPVVGDLNIAMVSEMHGAVELTITDLNGRVVRAEQLILNNGRNQLRLNTKDLGAGLYLVRITNDANTVSLRFVKTN